MRRRPIFQSCARRNQTILNNRLHPQLCFSPTCPQRAGIRLKTRERYDSLGHTQAAAEGKGKVGKSSSCQTLERFTVFVVFCATGCVEVESCGSVTFRPWVTWRGLSPRWFAVVSVVEEWKSAEESRHSCREVFRGCLSLLWAPKVEVRSISVFVEVFNT